jgi:hypothetical protein
MSTPKEYRQYFDPETTWVMGLAFEMARAALRKVNGVRPTDEWIAKRVIELAGAGELNADTLCDEVLASLPGPPPALSL